MKKIDLTQLKSGIYAKVVEVSGGLGFCRRLENLGIKEGVILKKLTEQLLSGPIIVEVGNSKVAIGFRMAKKIIVTPKPEPKED